MLTARVTYAGELGDDGAHGDQGGIRLPAPFAGRRSAETINLRHQR